MMLETLMVFGAWHPNHENEYEAFTPGLFVSLSDERRTVTPYATTGVYRDSYGKFAFLGGVGADIGQSYGVGVTFAHVHGSGLKTIPVVPIPSVFFRKNDYTARLIFSPVAIAFGVSYSFH